MELLRHIKSQSIPKSLYELKNNLIREFGTQINPAEIHLQLSKTEKTSKETHIEYFYRVKEIASRINIEEEDEKYYIIRGLKENRAIELQLRSCNNIEELKEKMKLLDIQEKSKSNGNEIMYPKYPVTRIPHHTNQFVRRQQYEGIGGNVSSYSRYRIDLNKLIFIYMYGKSCLSIHKLEVSLLCLLL
ncbi:hypothetical protein TNCV_3858741 [Trichonephila clavipes]|nr:hypothetical protein TNCV_3858741 [Trichonephila clavipes]